MSLNSAMQAGVAGLVANSTALSVISNNIANVNTVGYKQSSTDFESLVSAGEDELSAANSGGVARRHPAAGRPAGAVDPDQLAARPGDLRPGLLRGDQLREPGVGLDARALHPRWVVHGQQPGLSGQRSAGFLLQGWPADANGNITPNSSSLTSLQSINVSQVGGAVSPTTTVGVNVDSAQAVSAGAAAAGTTPRPTAWRCTKPTAPPASRRTTGSRSRFRTRRAASTPCSSTC